MASLDGFQEKVSAAIDQAKPLAESAKKAGAEFVEKANEWAEAEHPAAEKAYEAVGGVAAGAVDALADGANVAYEFIKDRVEEVSGKDLDADGQVGKISREDVVAGAELAGEAVSGVVEKVNAKIASVTSEDVQAGLDLAAEAVSGKVEKTAADLAAMTPEDVAAGAELAAEAVSDAVEKAAGDAVAAAELATEALTDAANESR